LFAFYLVTTIFPPDEECLSSPLEPDAYLFAVCIKIEEYFCQQEGGIIMKVFLILVIKYRKGKSIFVSELQPTAGTRSS